MRLRGMTVVGVLVLVILLFPVLLVSAAPPHIPFTLIGRADDECSVWWSSRPSGHNVFHDDGETLQPLTFVGGPSVVRATLGHCDGPPEAGACRGTIRLVLGAEMVSGECAATGMDGPDYWEGIYTLTGFKSNIRGVCVLKGYGSLRGLQLRGELDWSALSEGIWKMTGTIIETGKQ